MREGARQSWRSLSTDESDTVSSPITLQLVRAPFIGHLLDTKRTSANKLLILLALPRGLEPLFSP